MMMKSNVTYYIMSLFASLLLCACDDEDTFTASPSNLLTFSSDTIKLDTIFSTVPSSTRSFWVYNKSGDGLRCKSVRLENGNQVGFRVNVDGAYLSPSAGYQVSDIEIRDKDSIRVFVELTSPMNHGDRPVKIEDNIVFVLESGVRQKVNLNAYSWDAELIKNVVVDKDLTISGSKPIVVYGGIDVAENATLTVASGTTLFFHSDAGIDVHGRLVCEGTASDNVVLRGDRLDNMFDYLPYDCVSGQWRGVRFYEKSYDNSIKYTDIHGSFDGVRVDSADVSRLKLTIENSTVHNCQGSALVTDNANVVVRNCQLTNTLGDCLAVYGGRVDVNNSTLAQFYPFDSNRGVALRFSADKYPLLSFVCRNSLITGYADDEMMGEPGEEAEFNFNFDHCIIRTPKVMTGDSIRFVNVVFEEYTDTVKAGRKHFRKIDTENLRYDFRLDSISPAVDAANPETAMPTDMNGVARDAKPDIGPFEYVRKEEVADKP